MIAPTPADNNTSQVLSNHCAAFQPAGGMITSEGKGTKELSIVINNPTVQ